MSAGTTWFALYDQTSGALLSVGTVLADDLPANAVTKAYASRPDQGMMWDAGTRDFVAIPATVILDRWNDLLTNAAYANFATLYAGLSATRQTQLQTVVLKLLGGRRFRPQGEPIELDPAVAAGA